MAYCKVFSRGMGVHCRRTLIPGQIFETRSFRIQSKSSVLQYRVICEDGRIILKCMKIDGGGGDAIR